MGFLGYDKKTTTSNVFTTTNTDSFNTNASADQNWNNVGSVYLGDSQAGSAAVTGAAGAGVANLGQYLVPAALVLAGIYLLNRK